ncbi:MAG TPA: ABC transporter permease [Candidatus Acidoferrales bacterium]|jgi:putative ABC transport system permease protein|nr:ABC transporter permease [Candidatus Acidoferrales bacterium]
MFREILRQAWVSLRRQPMRSFLTMLGIVWGILAVTLLLAYGSGFRNVLMYTFEVFGKGAVVAWPGTTSEQAGGERAGKIVRFEQADVDEIRASAGFVKQICAETVKFTGISYEDRLSDTAIRGVYPEYGEMRNEIPVEGRWINTEDVAERRRVVFLGARLREKLFAGRPAVGETARIEGTRFTVIGTMARKFQDSNYFTSDDESAWIPYTTAGDLWNNRYASVIVFTPVAPQFEAKAMEQVRQAVAERQHFSPGDKRAITMFGREEFRPVMEGITIGVEGLLLFVGTLTLGIGGVGVMNIMLVSVNERIREIGLRRALGARKRHIRAQFLAEALALTLAGGAVGVLLSLAIGAAIGTLPFLGPAYEDTSGKVDIHMHISWQTVAISVGVLVVVGIFSGLMPAMRASRLDPVEALRYE